MRYLVVSICLKFYLVSIIMIKNLIIVKIFSREIFFKNIENKGCWFCVLEIVYCNFFFLDDILNFMDVFK